MAARTGCGFIGLQTCVRTSTNSYFYNFVFKRLLFTMCTRNAISRWWDRGTHSLTHSLLLTHSLTYSLTHSLTHSLIFLFALRKAIEHINIFFELCHLVYSNSSSDIPVVLDAVAMLLDEVDLWETVEVALTHSLTYSLTHWLTHSLTCLLTHLLTHSLAYSLTHLLTHSLIHL
jgi:hypothetical protein